MNAARTYDEPVQDAVTTWNHACERVEEALDGGDAEEVLARVEERDAALAALVAQQAARPLTLAAGRAMVARERALQARIASALEDLRAALNHHRRARAGVLKYAAQAHVEP